jgi:glyoxylase-like metal-dependent hydrolase (beta-lactamase superfamily II)
VAPRETAGNAWEVIAVRYGTLAATKATLYHRWSAYGEPDGPQSLDYYFWILRRGDVTILVDTGFDPDVARRRDREPLFAPLDAVARLAPAPSLVILTHLHYDHTGNVGGLGDVELRVPEREAAFWRTPGSRHPLFAEHAEIDDLALVQARLDDGSARTFAGGEMLAPGVQALDLPGHTPGQAGLLVETASGDVLLASDAVHLDAELEDERPFGIFCDLEDMIASFGAIKAAARAGATVIAGHDPDVARRFPALAGADGLAVRIA